MKIIVEDVRKAILSLGEEFKDTEAIGIFGSLVSMENAPREVISRFCCSKTKRTRNR
jgi:hypothetical protein